MPYVIFITFFLAIAYKTFLGKNLLVSLMPNIILLFGCARYLFFKKGRVYTGSIFNRFDFGIYIAFLILFALSLFRTGLPSATIIGTFNDVITLFLISLFGYLCTSYIYNKETFSLAASKSSLSIIIGPSLLILILIAFYVTQYNNLPSVGGNFRSKPLILGLLGFNLENKIIEVKGGSASLHPNTIGIFAGGLLVFTIFLLRFSVYTRLLRLILYIIIGTLGLMILISDSRVTIFNTLFSLAIIFIIARSNIIKLAPYLALAIPFLPFLSLFILSNIADYEFMAKFSKGANDIATGSERAVIWQYCMQELLDLKPIHLWGYGEYGHYRAGTSLLYDKVFGPDMDASLMVTHNMFLQAFYDVGYVGAFVFFILLYKCTNSAVFLFLNGKKYAIAYVGFLVYFMLSGTFESTFGYYNKTYTLILMLMCVTIFEHKNKYLKSQYLLKRRKTSEHLYNTTIFSKINTLK